MQEIPNSAENMPNLQEIVDQSMLVGLNLYDGNRIDFKITSTEMVGERLEVTLENGSKFTFDSITKEGNGFIARASNMPDIRIGSRA